MRYHLAGPAPQAASPAPPAHRELAGHHRHASTDWSSGCIAQPQHCANGRYPALPRTQRCDHADGPNAVRDQAACAPTVAASAREAAGPRPRPDLCHRSVRNSPTSAGSVHGPPLPAGCRHFVPWPTTPAAAGTAHAMMATGMCQRLQLVRSTLPGSDTPCDTRTRLGPLAPSRQPRNTTPPPQRQLRQQPQVYIAAGQVVKQAPSHQRQLPIINLPQLPQRQATGIHQPGFDCIGAGFALQGPVQVRQRHHHVGVRHCKNRSRFFPCLAKGLNSRHTSWA